MCSRLEHQRSGWGEEAEKEVDSTFSAESTAGDDAGDCNGHETS
jgi:hypothetical protein